MECFKTKEEANTRIQNLNETTSIIGKEYEPKKRKIYIYNQDNICTNTTKIKKKEQPNEHSHH